MLRRLSLVTALPVITTALLLLAPAARAEDHSDERDWIRAYYKEGLRYELTNGLLAVRIQLRGQFRYTHTDSEEAPDSGDLIGDEDDLAITRARVKLGGHVWQSWVKFYWEHDLVRGRLLDLRLHLQPRPSIGIRAGQYKVIYSRERVESSGRQTFVERSLVNQAFTLDRQRGATLLGRLFAGTAIDSTYAIGAFVGAGRTSATDESDRPMVVGRWQWNYLGRALDFSSTDIHRRPEPAGSLTLGAASYRGAFTRFSSAGGGQLPGFEPGRSDRYEVAQVMIESAFQHRGFAFNTEVHWKGIDDDVNRRYTNIYGAYGQVGYFFHEMFAWFPDPLELATRSAIVIAESPARDEFEYAVGANWHFIGHRSKLSFDLTWFDYQQTRDEDSAWRSRIQWDLSF